MIITSVVFGVLFIISGLLICVNCINIFLGKNKKSKEELNDPKFKAFARNVGTLIIVGGIIFTINGISTYYADHVFKWLVLAWLVLAIGDLCFILNKRPKKKNVKNKGGTINERKES